MIFNQEDTLFLIIDIQDKLINSTFNKEVILKKTEILSKAASILDIPVIITEQYPKGLGETINLIKNNCQKAMFFEKTNFNAYSDEALVNAIKNSNKKQIVLFGIETHICVMQTALNLIEDGYAVAIIKDACGSRTSIEYDNGLQYLKSSGIKIKTTEMLIFELLKSSKHPKFKEIQNLIK